MKIVFENKIKSVNLSADPACSKSPTQRESPLRAKNIQTEDFIDKEFCRKTVSAILLINKKMESEREPLLYNSKNKEYEERIKKRNILILGLGFFFGKNQFNNLEKLLD